MIDECSFMGCRKEKRMTVKEASKTVEGYLPDCDTRKFVLDIIERAEKKKVKDCDFALPIYDTDGCQNDVLFAYRAKCPKCSYVILDGDFYKFDANDLEINFCVRCGQALDWSDVK